jgi:putative nucleotide binding protein
VVRVHKDEHVRILDFLPKGKSEMPPHKRKPLAQAIGESFFSLLEITPREGISFTQGERVYIGEGTRDKVDHIERRIKYDWLTPTAKSELPEILKSIVTSREDVYVSFYNTAGSISTRQHKLECLPKIGKRHRQDILDERSKEPFKNFEDMRNRLKNVPDPARVIVDKIVEELKGESKYYLFTPITDLKEKL